MKDLVLLLLLPLSTALADVPSCLPGPRQGAAPVTRSDGHVLLVGGSISARSHCRGPYIELSSIVGGPMDGSSWRVVASMPAGRTHASAVMVNVTLYILGGYGPGRCLHSPSRDGKCASHSVWAMNMSLENPVAVTKSPMPFNRSNFGIAVVEGRIYTAGGYGNYGDIGPHSPYTMTYGSGGCTQPDVNLYDPATDRWQRLPPMPTHRAGLALVGLAGYLFAIGGFQCTNGPSHTISLATVEAYSLRSHKWSTEAPLPEVTALHTVVETGNASVLLVGGFNGTSGADMKPEDLLRQVIQGQLDQGGHLGWSPVSQLPAPRGFMSVAVSGTNLLLMGGYNAATGNDSALVEVMDTQSLAWHSCHNVTGSSSARA